MIDVAIAAAGESTQPSVKSLPAPVVEIRDLCRRFGDVLAVSDVSLAVSAGEVFALIGPNGAGKSTLMKMLTTLLPLTSGEARVAGFDVRRQAGLVRRHIGYVPQLLSADPDLTGYENMLLSARLYLIPRRERAERIVSALAMMDLLDARDRSVRTYSGGMARRLEIAQSTLHKPAVLFLDEPTVGLDPNGRLAVWRHVRQLNEERGTTIVFSTHYMEEAEDLADRIALISAGRLAAIGKAAELKARHEVATLDDLFAKLTGAALAGEGQR